MFETTKQFTFYKCWFPSSLRFFFLPEGILHLSKPENPSNTNVLQYALSAMQKKNTTRWLIPLSKYVTTLVISVA
jgi:hypothetical protein